MIVAILTIVCLINLCVAKDDVGYVAQNIESLPMSDTNFLVAIIVCLIIIIVNIAYSLNYDNGINPQINCKDAENVGKSYCIERPGLLYRKLW